jgi:choline-glycine betaine transporter
MAWLYDKTQQFLLTSSQCFTALQQLGLLYSFPCLNTILIVVACAQFQKVKAAVLDIRQEHIRPNHVQEDEQVHNIAKCKFQAKLNACIRSHQEIIG